ncbi:hypothetical protein B0H10DRAFT_2192987 [Mycena sp. CBHHK59/15]|nr:hypothetical protein B0H10DRAFT_2192987 [Mycena sp. CBHHK59/15]
MTGSTATRSLDQQRVQVQASAVIENQNEAINATLGTVVIPAIHVVPRRENVNIPSAAEEEMWNSFQVDGASFSAGEDPAADALKQQMDLANQADTFGPWNAASIAHNLGFSENQDEPALYDERDEEYEILCEMMDNACLFESPNLDEMVDNELGQVRSASSSEWYPYPSKMVFLWILTEGGAHSVPSLNALRKVQATLHKQGGVETVPWTSSQGNVFHLNDLHTIIAKIPLQTNLTVNMKDYANPLTRAHLHFYPEIPDGPVSEAWHAQKWRREIDRDTLTPMIVDGYRHFYVDELARLRDGSFVIPLCWVICKGKMHADAFTVTVDQQGVAKVDDSKETFILAADLVDNYFDLEYKKALPSAWDNYAIAKYSARMPNPLRSLANGRPLYTSFVDLFFDDVSGNRSKSWNKHYNCYATHRNLPRRILQQEFHTHFITRSPNASSSEQFEGIKTQIESTHSTPVSVFDESTKQEAAFRLFVNTGPSDNPMGSEITGHIGAKELHKQVELACLGVKAAVKARQTDTGVKDAYTNYWIENLLRRSRELKKGDPNLDSAEIIKELMDWVEANESKIYNPFLSMKDRLQATDTMGLSIPAIRAGYIMQFANSLIGRQFKQRWASFCPFCGTPKLITLINTDPTKIIAKNKLHIMAHAGGTSCVTAHYSRLILQALLGWTDPKPLIQGSIKLQPLKRTKVLSWVYVISPLTVSDEGHAVFNLPNYCDFKGNQPFSLFLRRNLWAPVPLLTPEARIAKHHELAAQLRQKQPKPKHKQAQDNDEQDGDEPEDAQEAAPKSKTRKRKKGNGSSKQTKSRPAKKGKTKQEVHSDAESIQSEVESRSSKDEGETGIQSEADEMDVDSEEEYVPRPTRRPRGRTVAAYQFRDYLNLVPSGFPIDRRNSSESYANGRDSNDFPLLTRFGGAITRAKILDPGSIQDVSEDETTLVDRFFEGCWHLPPPNSDGSQFGLPPVDSTAVVTTVSSRGSILEVGEGIVNTSPLTEPQMSQYNKCQTN